MTNDKLRAAIQRLDATPFPQEIVDDHLRDLHAELAEYDGYINGLLRQVLRGEKPTFPLGRDPELRGKLEYARDVSSDRSQHDAERLLAYLDVMEAAIDIAIETLRR